MKRLLSVVFVSLLLCSMLFAAGSKESTTQAQGVEQDTSYSGTVMLYSSTGEDVILALKGAFEARYPNVKLDYYSATSGKCVTKLSTEFQTNSVTCDVAWLADPSAMIKLKADNHLVQYFSPYAEKMDAKFKDADGYYTGARLLIMGITYSTIACSDAEAPYDYLDLLKDNFKGQIVMSDPTGSGSTKALVYALSNNPKYGWSYFEKLAAMGTELQSSSGAVNNAVAAGSYKIAFGVDYNTKNLMDQESPLGWHDTTDIVAVPCPIGIPTGAPHEELAKLLYDFILDPNGGQQILTQKNIAPVVDGVKLPEEMLTASEIAEKALPIDWKDLAVVSNNLLDKFNSYFKK